MSSPQRSWLIAFAILAFFVVVIVAAFVLGPSIGVWQVLKGWQTGLEQAGVPGPVAYGFVTIGSIPFIFASLKILGRHLDYVPTWWPKAQWGSLVIILVYLGGVAIGTYMLSAKWLIGKKYCPVDLAVYNSGTECRMHLLPIGDITPSVASAIIAKRNGVDVTPTEVSLSPDGPFFHARGGLATAYFGADMAGRLHAYSHPGTNPYDRTPLLEPTPEVRARYRLQQLAEVEQARLVEMARESVLTTERTATAMRAAREAKLERARAAVRPYHSPYESRPLTELLRLVPMQPDNADLHYAIGMLCLESGDRAGALRSFREARRANPGMSQATARLHELGGE